MPWIPVGFDPNALDLVRSDSDYTADYGEHVVSDGGDITLPEPSQDEMVMVSKFDDGIAIIDSVSGSVDDEADVVLGGTEPVVFVSGGEDWWSVSGFNNLRSIIPNALVSRPDDDATIDDDDRPFGHEFQTTEVWLADTMQFRLSSNISGATRAYIYDNDDNELASKDISHLSAGDLFTIDQRIEADTTYKIVTDAEGDEYTVGRFTEPDYPYESDETDQNNDPILSITNGALIGSSANQAYNIVEIGNLN